MARTELTVPGIRVYLDAERRATLKIGETFSLDRGGDPHTHVVAFDGFGMDGCYRWRREGDGRVFLYVAEQCDRLIYHLRPHRLSVSDAIDVVESVAGFTDESTPVGEAWARLKLVVCSQ